MSFKEALNRTIKSFFVTVPAASIVLVIFAMVVGRSCICFEDLVGMFLISIVGAVTNFLYYSKKEVSRISLIIRHIAHILIIIATALYVLYYLNWLVQWRGYYFIIFLLLVIATHIITMTIENIHAKILVDKMTEKLKKIYSVEPGEEG